MNIFVLDHDPMVAAIMHCDKHVVKMILETAQMLSTAHHVHNSAQAPFVYKKAHINHPCTIWVRESFENYDWSFQLFFALNREFSMRRGKNHESWIKMHKLLSNNPAPRKSLTPFAQAMPEQYKCGDAVKAYRAYYKGEKARFATWNWNGAATPYWWTQESNT